MKFTNELFDREPLISQGFLIHLLIIRDTAQLLHRDKYVKIKTISAHVNIAFHKLNPEFYKNALCEKLHHFYTKNFDKRIIIVKAKELL